MTNEKTISLAGTAAFHVLLVLFLLFYYIKPSDKENFSAELGGVPVMFGNVADAYGDDEPYGRGNGMDVTITEPIESDPTMPNYIENDAEEIDDPTPIPTPAPTIPETSTKPATPPVTQDMEQTIALEAERKAAEEKRIKEEAAAESKRRAEAAEAERKAREEAERKKNINSLVGGAFGGGQGNGSRGNTHGSGTQGSPSGNSSSGKLSGIAGIGTYDLGGRGLGQGGLKLPSYNVDDYGTVVVDIIVDPKGNVIETSIGRGTNTTNSSLRNESLKAARQTKFSIVNTTGNQKGTITYKFNLN